MKSTYWLSRQSLFKTKLILFIVATLILINTLAFGLAPRGSFDNDWVSWDQSSNLTRLGKFGIVTGDFSDLATLSEEVNSASFTFTITPELPPTNHFTVLLQIHGSDDTSPFIIGQWKTFFVVMQGADFKNEGRTSRLVADLADYIDQSVHLQITIGATKNTLSVNGNLQISLNSSQYILNKNLASISIGNSPDGKRGWSGQIEQLVISLQSSSDESYYVTRDYAFNQNNLPQVRDLTENKSHLVAPKPGRFPSPNLLKPISLNQLLAGDLLTDFIVNILGFMPLGFITALLFWFNMRKPSFTTSLVVTTLLLGFLVSLFIEYAQLFLPGRSSHLHDLILNVCGQLTGLLAFWLFSKSTKLGSEK